MADTVPVDLEGDAGRPTDPQREEDGHEGVLDQHDNSPLTTPPASHKNSMPDDTNESVDNNAMTSDRETRYPKRVRKPPKYFHAMD